MKVKSIVSRGVLFGLSFVLTSALVSHSALAESKVLTEAELKDYQKKISGSDYLSVDFTQARYSTLRKKERRSQGTARFSKPDKFRWRLETPVADQWIFDGITVYNYNPANKQAVKFSAGGKAQDLMQVVDLVMNFDTLLKRYAMQSAHDVGDRIEVVLIPKSNSDMTRIDLHIDEKGSYVSHLKMHMVGGDYTALDFHNPIRTKIDDKEYSLPGGVKVSEGT